jgi:ElaB/YqjD/DUF883 family membrane-anchored ribosome-binding protein
MAETPHRTADVPDFTGYPSERPLPERVAGRDGGAALEEKARQVGAALGSAVVTLREARHALQQAGSNAREVAGMRVNELAEAVKNKTREWGEAATSRAGELRQATVEKAQDIRSQVKTGYYRTRLGANRLVREYPLHLVLAAGAVGFLLGVGLRIWRSNSEY